MRYFIREIKSYRYVAVLLFILIFVIRTIIRANLSPLDIVNDHLLRQVNLLEAQIKENNKFLRQLYNQIDFADSFTKINGHIGKVFKLQ